MTDVVQFGWSDDEDNVDSTKRQEPPSIEITFHHVPREDRVYLTDRARRIVAFLLGSTAELDDIVPLSMPPQSERHRKGRSRAPLPDAMDELSSDHVSVCVHPKFEVTTEPSVEEDYVAAKKSLLYQRDTDLALLPSNLSSKQERFRSYLQGVGICFNCGCSGHAFYDCPIEVNPEKVQKSRQARQTPSSASKGIDRSDSKRDVRYYGEGHDAEESRKAFGSPGKLSERMLEALGIKATDPPPWIFRMRRYGYPPAYLKQSAPASSSKISNPSSSTPKVGASMKNGELNADGTPKLRLNRIFNLTFMQEPEADIPTEAGESAHTGDNNNNHNSSTTNKTDEDDNNASSKTVIVVDDIEVGEPLYPYPGLNAPIPVSADSQQWVQPAHLREFQALPPPPPVASVQPQQPLPPASMHNGYPGAFALPFSPYGVPNHLMPPGPPYQLPPQGFMSPEEYNAMYHPQESPQGKRPRYR
jgi:hypothetical protein